jgi:hypothetical protein
LRSIILTSKEKEQPMPTLAQQILTLLGHTPGLTDREITDSLRGHSENQQPINQKCHALKAKGVLARRTRPDGLIGNYLVSQSPVPPPALQVPLPPLPSSAGLSEDEVKRHLEKWLIASGWQPQVAWGRQPGVDIQARKASALWLIEVKGSGSLSAMRVNYFLGALGELLQRMDNPAASYSIAFPDLQQFRRLWDRLPALAKQRMQVTALFVDQVGNVVHG